MKFKLDENFGKRTQRIFIEAGHDVKTVYEEKLSGQSDDKIFSHCGKENRCLVTLDLDFANVLRFPPEKSSGIVIVRTPQNPSLELLEDLVAKFMKALEVSEFKQDLWIVEIGRIRIHQKEN